MDEETLIISVKYDTKETERRVDTLTDSIDKNTDAIKENRKLLKQSDEEIAKTGKTRTQLSREIEENKIQLSRERAERKANIQLLKASANSRDQLKAKLSLLRKEVDQVTLSEGKNSDKVKQLNKQIDTLDKQLRNTADGYRKNKIDIGNYSKALKGIPGPLGMIASKGSGMLRVLKSMGKLPILIVITALVAAFQALKQMFTRNQDAADKLQQKMAFLKGAFEGFKDFVADFGKNLIIRMQLVGLRTQILIERLRRNKEAVAKLKAEIDNLKNSMEDLSLKGIGDAAKGFEELAKKQQELERLEIGSILRRAKLVARISDLVKLTRDETKSYDEKAKALVEARKIQEEIFRIDEAIAIGKLEQIKTSNKLTKTMRSDSKEQAVAEAELFRIRKEYNDKDRELLNRQNELRNKMGADQKKRNDENKKRNDELIKDEEELEAEIEEMTDQIFDSYVENFEKKQELLVVEIDNEKELREKSLQNTKDFLNESLELFGFNYDERFMIAQRFTNSVLDLQKKRLDGEKITAGQIKNIAYGLTSDLLAERNKRLDSEIAGLEKAREKRTAQQNEALTNFKGTEEEKTKLQETINEHNRQLDASLKQRKYEATLKEFRANKLFAIAQIALNTAIAVTESLPNIPLSVIIGGIGLAQGVYAGLQKPPPPPSFEDGGEIKTSLLKGPSHLHGGINLRDDSGRVVANAQGDERIFVLKREATAKINALSAMNEASGGAAFSKRKFLQDGGEIDTSQDLTESLKNITLVVKVDDIKKGLVENTDIINVGLV